MDRSARVVETGPLVAMAAAVLLTWQGGSWAVAQATTDIASLRVQLDEAIGRRDPAKAAALAERLVEAVEPHHVEALYAAARAHAQLGHRAEAYLYLNRAIDAGFWDRARLNSDGAFEGYRQDELFRSLAKRAWARGYANLLERPNREEVQKSPEIMKALAFKPGERVADIGAGTGYFTIPVAKAVGPTGHVSAIDISPEMLEFLDLRIKAHKLDNVELSRVTPDDPQLAPGSVDTILMVDSIHYVKDRTTYAGKLRAGLAPGGRLVIIDYRPKPISERPWGPPPEQQFPRETLDAEMAAAGFKVVAAHDFLPEQFFVVYAPR
jgi:SAM-dependent methyltransferase